MAFVTIEEDESKEQFIYPRSKYTVVSVVKKGGTKGGWHEIVARGMADGTFGLSLDEGNYRLCINSLATGPEDRCKWTRDFTVGEYTEEEMKKLNRLKAKWAKPIHMSEGARWNCTYPGCNNSATSHRGAALHEHRDHLGIDPLQATRADVIKATKKAMRA